MSGDLLNVAQIAKRLTLSESAVYDLLASGRLRHFSIGARGKTKRCSEEQIAEYLAAQERGGGPQAEAKGPRIPKLTELSW